MLNKEILYSLDDVAIIPADTSDVDHRSNCNPYKYFGDGKYLPIFTAPMFNVVNKDTLDLYEKNNIIPILPRVKEEEISILERVKLSKRYWCAFGLDEFITNFAIGKTTGIHYVLVDIANGNMNKLIRGIKTAKAENPELVIMAGNVANPKTYVALAYAGADYVRVSVGSGSVCTTASNLGIFYGMASLIQECFNKKLAKKLTTKIVADGGIKGSRYIIKALALGADYVIFHGARTLVIEEADYAERFYLLNERAKQFGVQIAHENVVHYVGEQPGFLTRLRDHLGGDFRMVLDLKQAKRAGADPFAFLQRLGENIVHIHVSDSTAAKDCLPPGEGTFDFVRLKETLVRLGYDRTLMIELYHDNFTGDAQLTNALHFLQNLF